MAFSPVAQTVGSGVSSANQNITCAGTIGNFLVLIYARSGGLATGAVTSITDTGGNTWSAAAVARGTVSGGPNTRIEVWTARLTASPGTITVNSGTAQTNSWNISEWSGVATSSFDVASPDNSGGASATTQTVPNVTTTAAADLLIAGWHFAQTTTSGLTAGWTALTDFDDAAVGSGRAAYQTGGLAGTVTGPSITLGTAHSTGYFLVAFFAAPSAGIPNVVMAVQ